MAATDSQHPIHLQGNGAPVHDEVTVTDLEVSGTIPPELDGRYLRNGSNPASGMSAHPFLGDGMIHGVRLRDGRAEWYRNRFVQTPFIVDNDPDRDALDIGSMGDKASSLANTHVVGHAGRILALEELHAPYVLDGELNTVGPTDFDGRLPQSFTAHPKICPTTGEMLAFGYYFLEPYLTYLRISAEGELVQVEPVTVGGPTMIHDFNITENNVVFMDLPVVFDLRAAVNGELPYSWSDDYPARLGVMPRTGSDADVVWYGIDPCYVFHPMNAYEEGDRIVLDVCRFDYLWRDDGMDFPDPVLWRWTIDTATGQVSEEQVDDRFAEFPRVPDSLIGRKHRYGYASPPDLTFRSVGSGAVLKYDRQTDTCASIELGKGRVPGEVVFVPSESAATEDDGYLMTYVYDAASNRSEFVIFDAASLSSDPVATINLPRVPFGFHGSWIPAS